MLCCLVSGVLAAPADAHGRPSVTVTLQSSVDQGQALALTWHASALPRGTRIALQRQVGTARVWKTLKRLYGSGGSTSVPAFELGIYRLRVVALGRHSQVYVQRQRTLKVFGPVPLGALVGGSGQSGTNTTPTRTFPYVFKIGDLACCGNLSDAGLTVPATNNTCRSVHLDVTSDGATYSDG